MIKLKVQLTRRERCPIREDVEAQMEVERILLAKEGVTLMSAYLKETSLPENEYEDTRVADPKSLGFGLVAIATVILGCYFANFIIPSAFPTVRTAVGVIQSILGIVLLLVGMWEFRRNNTPLATFFTLYGGFLVALGLLLTPLFGFWSTGFSFVLMSITLGLLFLAWTIFLAVLLGAQFMTVGAKRHPVEATFLVLLLLAYFFLMIGALAQGNIPLLRIGGWLAILASLVSWVAMFMYMAHLIREPEAPQAQRRVAPQI